MCVCVCVRQRPARPRPHAPWSSWCSYFHASCGLADWNGIFDLMPGGAFGGSVTGLVVRTCLLGQRCHYRRLAPHSSLPPLSWRDLPASKPTKLSLHPSFSFLFLHSSVCACQHSDQYVIQLRRNVISQPQAFSFYNFTGDFRHRRWFHGGLRWIHFWIFCFSPF